MGVSYSDVKLVIVEDEKEIADAINDNIKLHERLGVPKLDYIHIASVVELRNLFGQNKGMPWQYIVDLRLNDRNTLAGIEALKLILSNDPSRKPIVYTAYGSRDNKDACIRAGILMDHFYQKRILVEDMEDIGSKIANQIQDDVRGKSENILPYQSVIGITSGTIINTIETHIHLKDLVDKGYEFHQLSVVEESHRYAELSFHQQLFVCNSFLQRHRKGHSYFSVGIYLAEIYLETIEIDHEITKPQPDQLFVQYWTDPDQGHIQGLHLFRNGTFSVRAFLPDLNAVRQFIEAWKVTGQDLNDLERDLCEYFASQRLFQLLIYNGAKSEEVIDLVKQLNHKKGQTEFITALWEWTTIKTRDAVKTNIELATLYEAGFDRIDDIFYGQVEQVFEEDRIVETNIASVDKLTDVFPRAFDFDFLQEPGIRRRKACFKLIIYTPGKNNNSRPGRTHFVEPILQEAYHDKLK